jgi:orotidine-5'-phosphate decarboxylase
MATMRTVKRASFGARLDAAARERRSVLCVGLDPQPALLPDEVWRGVRTGPAGTARAVERFCLGIVEAVAPYAVAVKPQLAFFEALGHAGLATAERVCEAAREAGLLVIVDAKRGDVPSTAAAYAAAYLGPRGEAPPLGDALTVNPYLGMDSLEPFLTTASEEGCGVLVLVRTTNPGGADLQELELAAGGRVWEHVAGLVAAAGGSGEDLAGGEGLASVGAVVGANQPQVLRRARELMPRAPFLLPGIGAQGGTVDDLAPAFAPGPGGGLVSASRSVLYAWREGAGSWQGAAADEARRLGERAWQLATGR